MTFKMVPKKGRANKEKETQTFIAYNRLKFSNAKTKLKFDKVVEIKTSFIMERGMDFELVQNFQFEGITNVIVIPSWRRFINEPKVVVESIVQEFYANVSYIVENKIKVHNVLALFRPFGINFHYGLIDISKGEYETYLSNMDYVAVIGSLIIEGAKLGYAGGTPRGFGAKSLDKVSCI